MIRRLLINQKKRDEVAIIEGEREVTYGTLIDKGLALQRFLADEIGVVCNQPLLTPNKNKHIAILLPNGGDYIAALWGTLLSGLTAFPLSVLMTGHEIFPLLHYAHVSTVITSTVYRHLFEERPSSVQDTASLKIIYMEEINPIVGEQNIPAATVDSAETMLLLNTSGTTGRCKIVQLTERNVEAAVLGYLDKLQLEETGNHSIRFLLAVPFSSVYGMMVLSACLMRSFPVVILTSPFTLEAFYRSAEKHSVTHYEGSASTMLLMAQMKDKPHPYQIDTLTCLGFGGSKVSGHIIESLYRAYPGKHFFQGYGMTEAAPLITKHPNAKVEKTASVGTAIKGLDIAIATEEGIVHTPHTMGEIIVSGANVMLRYYENEAETKRVLKEGYLYTGDMGYLDEEGYLYLCGRKKNIIIVRGFKVYPEEVEECIQNSQLVRDCVVYGQMDAYGNEIVCADIVPIHDKVSTSALCAYCAGHLAWYKRPERVSICEKIQKNEAGKVERRKGYAR